MSEHFTSRGLILFMKVLGHMMASFEAVMFAQLHARPLQHNVLTALDKLPVSGQAHAPLSKDQDILACQPCSGIGEIVTPDDLGMPHDSLLVLGGVLGMGTIQGTWSL